MPALRPERVARTPLAPAAAGTSGGNRVQLLQGGAQLFPAMCQAFADARQHIWLASYIFHDDACAQQVLQALAQAAGRGVSVRVVVDGFGSKASLASLRAALAPAGAQLQVFRPLDRWWRALHPSQLRRLHQKLCAVDGRLGFVGGINVLDDRLDLNHGWSEQPRLDYAVAVRGPVVAAIEQAIRAVWHRAALGEDWRDELRLIWRSPEPVAELRRSVQQWRHDLRSRLPAAPRPLPAPSCEPMRAALLLRDNVGRRRAIEQAYVQAMRAAQRRIDIVCPYFYPGRAFRRTLRQAARRGVRVRLLLQGKLDYRLAGMAARALYDELAAAGVQVHEYTPAFLHGKVALVDDDWATVGSSNIDPLSLLLNLEANLLVCDRDFSATLAQALDAAFADSQAVPARRERPGAWAVLRRGLVAWLAYWLLRLAGVHGRY